MQADRGHKQCLSLSFFFLLYDVSSVAGPKRESGGKIRSYFADAREELIGKFCSNEISARVTFKFVNAAHGGPNIFTLSIPELGETRRREKPTAGVPHFLRYIERNGKFSRLSFQSKETAMHILFAEKNVSFVAC